MGAATAVSAVSQQEAVRVFAERLTQRPALDDAGLDALCQAHPELEEELRRLAHERKETKVAPPRVTSPSGPKLGRARGSRKRYVLLGEVARGGMGVVLHVWDTVLERPLAMKMLEQKDLPEDEDEAEEARQRFVAEARIAGQLLHPGVVPIYDLGTDSSGRMYFTMPFFEGRTLSEIFELAHSRSQGWSVGRALLALSKVCDVIAWAHARGVVHCDLKPANVVVSELGEVLVLDWGLAKVLDREREPRTKEAEADDARADDSEQEPAQNGTVAGTPPYMAPEQAQGRAEEISVRADVYALGAMLYRLLAGRAPYVPRQGREEPEKTVELIRRGPPTPLQRLAPDAPPALVAISEKAMARDPQARYASVEDLARELRESLDGRQEEGVR